MLEPRIERANALNIHHQIDSPANYGMTLLHPTPALKDSAFLLPQGTRGEATEGAKKQKKPSLVNRPTYEILVELS